MNVNNVKYFASFGVEEISKETITFKGSKSIKRNIYIIKVYNSIMYGYFLLDLLISRLRVNTMIKSILRSLKLIFWIKINIIMAETPTHTTINMHPQL